MKTSVKTILFFVSFFYLSLYIPIFCSLYFPQWYTVNCGFHDRCDRVGIDKSRQGIAELVSYYRHTAKSLPSSFWTPKEKSHLEEVRRITDGLFVAALFFALAFGLCFKRSRLRRFSRVNILLVLALVAVLPVFPYFWRHVFHPLLFANKNWLNTPRDFSYYILPRTFFRNTVIYLIASASLINLSAFFLSMNGKNAKTPEGSDPSIQ